MILVPLPRRVGPTAAPPFCPGVRGIDEGFGEINLSAVAQILGEALEQPIQPATPLPELKAAMAGLVRGIPTREIRPRGAGAQHPQDAVEDGAWIGPRSPTAVGTTTRTKRRFENRPLGVSEVHAARYDASRPVVTRRVTDL